jgi:hypothetical protein
MISTNELANAAAIVSEMESLDISMAQAVSVCSVVVETNQQRFELEDVVDGLDERFGGLIPRSQIQSQVEPALKFGLVAGLFEQIDTETFSLSSAGIAIGTDWLQMIHAA